MPKSLYVDPDKMRAEGKITFKDIPINVYKKSVKEEVEEGNYTKHYFPKEDIMKVFLKGGSNLQVNVRTGEAVYESVTRRPLIGAMARLHYNPGQWWTYFADIFAVGLIIITLSGVIMLKGNKGIIGRGGIEMIVGIVIPVLFLLFF